jgi:hypothetical protein
MKSNLTRRKNGSYVLKHKTTKGKKGDCVECGQNEKNHDMGLLYRHVAHDMILVQQYIENHLTEYKKHKSIEPIWCETCKALTEYNVEVDIDKILGFNAKSK